MYWSVKQVKPLENYQLLLTFEDKKVKIFDMKPYLEIGIFKDLKDISMFNSVAIHFDSVVWQNEADFDPKQMYNLGFLVS
ncbi:MAG: DUF2442 domain-containing protein [Cytophagales bacterium]|nr:MAG: DUF2442 domain-containing protein [Cytophagales bacterium]